jgi:hypothetical protein
VTLPTRSRKAALGLLVASMGVSWARPSSAQNANDKAAAEALFDQGKALMAAGNYAAACPKFSESLHLDEGVGTSLWLAECFQRSGKIASAWAQFREAAATAVKSGDPREKVAREHAVVLEPMLPKLVIVVPKDVAASQLKIVRDGEEVGPGLWGTAVPIDAGDHTIVASADRKKPFTTVAHIGQSARTETVAIPVLEDDPYAPVDPVTGLPRPEGPPITERDPRLRLIGVAVAGVGIAGLALGTVFGVEAMTNLNESNSVCTPGPRGVYNCSTTTGVTERSTAQSDATGSTIGFAVGGALVVGGGLLYFFAPKVTHKARSAMVLPEIAPGRGGLSVVGDW